ncbi:efflux RND transporter periplasmic adaptor subunit [Rhodopseudomonas pseudopalustris]
MTASTSPTMIFVHQGDRTFPQEVVQRLRPGAEAEIAFDAIPGRVFPGRVSVMLDAVSQGQLQASRTLLDPQSRAQSPGLVSVNVDITDHLTGYQLPAGASAKGRRLQRQLEGRGYRPAHPAADEELAKLPRLRPLG